MRGESLPSAGASLPVIACELSVLSEGERRRRALLADAVRASVVLVTDLPSGFAFHLDRRPTTAQQVEELIALERLCCPFMAFATRIDPASGRLVLELTGGTGVRGFIVAQFGIERRLNPKEAP
jgi:hypothetical protein